MKELLVFIISILILIIFFDMFCVHIRLSGFIKFAFSALIVFTALSFLTVIISRFPNNENHFNDISTKNETMALEQITYLEGIIETRLKIEEEIKSDVKITYNQEESGVIKYLLLEIYIEESQNIDKSKIEKIASEYLDCRVIVYV